MRGALFAALVIAAQPVAGQDFSGVVERVDGAVGRVVLDTATGSGFIVARQGDQLIFLTNYHLVDDGARVEVGFGRNGEVAMFEATVEHASPTLDLAVLRLRQIAGPAYHQAPLEIASRKPRKAEPVAAIGFPMVADRPTTGIDDPAFYESTFSPGVVSRVFNGAWANTGANFELVQHTAPVSPGNSGGPLIDLCGDLLGVHSYVPRPAVDGSAPIGTSWASSSGTVVGFLASRGVPYTLDDAPCAGDRAAAVQPPAEAAPAQPRPPRAGAAVVPRAQGGTPGWLIAVLGVVGVAAVAAVAYVGWRHMARPTEPEVAAKAPAAPAPRREPGLELVVSGRDGAASHHDVTASQLRSGVTIGRAASAGIRLDDRKLSREHVRLQLRGRGLTITDLGSTNGTLVDGRRLSANQTTQINSSSVIGLGESLLRVRRPSAEDRSAAKGGSA